MTTVVSAAFQYVQQCSIILLTQYMKEPVVCVPQGSYRPTAELTCPPLFNATENH